MTTFWFFKILVDTGFNNPYTWNFFDALELDFWGLRGF